MWRSWRKFVKFRSLLDEMGRAEEGLRAATDRPRREARRLESLRGAPAFAGRTGEPSPSRCLVLPLHGRDSTLCMIFRQLRTDLAFPFCL